MPATVNGIGTTYAGKKNVEDYQGVCESCGHAGMLSDYETGHYICVLFIPIIPIGRKMILGYCNRCTQHRVMPLKQWEQLKEESINAGFASLSENSKDPEKAIELLGTFTAFKQYDQATQLAAATVKTHADDYDTIFAIAGWYEAMEMKAKSDECFDLCLELDFDRDSSRRIRCVNHLEAKEMPQAESLAWELFEKNKDETLGVMFMLANTYIDLNQQQKAYECHERLVQSTPELKDDKQYCKSIRDLEKELGVAHSIVPKKKWFGLLG